MKGEKTQTFKEKVVTAEVTTPVTSRGFVENEPKSYEKQSGGSVAAHSSPIFT